MNTGRKISSMAGALLMGDALGYVVGRSRYVEVWRGRGRRRTWNRLLDWFEKHPLVCASLALGEAVVGVALVRRSGHA